MRYILQILPVFILLFNSVEIKIDRNEVEKLIHQLQISDNDSAKQSILQVINIKLDSLENDSALFYWNTIFENCNKLDYYYGLAFCSYNTAKLYNTKGEYFKSYQAYQESKRNYEKINYIPGLARVYNGLGIVFKNLSKFNLSLNNYSESARLFKELKDTIREGWIYLNIGGMLEMQDSLEQAKMFLAKSEDILEKLNDINLISCYINFGEVYKKEQKYDSAYSYYLKSCHLSKNNGDANDKFQANYHLGKFLFEQNKISEAEHYLTEAYNITQIENNWGSIPVNDCAVFANILSRFYILKADSAKAYEFLLQSNKYEVENKREQSNNILSKIEFDTLEQEAYVHKKTRDLIIGFSIIGLLTSILLIFTLYRNYKNKQKANRLLTEMDELKTQLYSNITHELRTPLTLILGPLEQMLSSEAKKKTTRKQVKMIRKNANSILSLVNQMLDLAKIEAKNIKLELVEDDINKFLRTRFTAFSSLAEQKSIRYNYSLLKEKNLQKFDAAKLEKIINNLLSNAVKFTPENGVINCFAKFPKQNILELSVQDSGKGMPENEINKIFDRFHQIENSEISNIIGTGIGLALTKELVELMHGTIEAKSELGKGSRFKVTLKLGTEHLKYQEYHLIKNNNLDVLQSTDKNELKENLDECESHRDYETINTELPSILIAEDHSDIREFIAENLKNCYNIDQAENGEIGLKKAVEKIPDLIITDVIMPTMDGIEFCQNLKTDQRTSHIPVIMLTGKSNTDDKMKGLEIGADAYLTKPFNIRELQVRVKKLIEQRNKLRKRFTKNLKLEPKDIAITSVDEAFLTHALEIIEKNIGNTEFTVKHFQEECFMSRMQLFRKIKALTNQTPSEFIRTIRLKRAASLIDKNFGNIAQITFEVGFNNPSYFSKCFKELYGKLPSEYLKSRN